MNAAEARQAMKPEPAKVIESLMKQIHAGIESVAKRGGSQIRIAEPKETFPGLREEVKKTLQREGYKLTEVTLENSRIKPGRIVWDIDWSD